MLNVATTARKWGIAVVGVLAQAAASGLLPEQYQPWGAVVIALATALGVYGVRNHPAPAELE